MGVHQHWASQLGVPYSEDPDESINDPAVDIVSVGCEIERRSALIVRAAEAGKHLWIDKFSGATLAEAEASAVPGTLFRIAGNDDCNIFGMHIHEPLSYYLASYRTSQRHPVGDDPQGRYTISCARQARRQQGTIGATIVITQLSDSRSRESQGDGL